MSDTVRVPAIKICGIRNPGEALYLNEAHADYAGFVFHAPSKRNVSLDEAVSIADSLDKSIKRVAVLVSPAPADIEMIQSAHFADILQIHGTLSAETAETVRLPVWYAVNLSGDLCRRFISDSVKETSVYKKHMITAVVADAADYGSGRTFDWDGFGPAYLKEQEELRRYGISFVLAGGLNADNVSEGIRLFHPDVVDVSSGVEDERGKNMNKITAFVRAVRGE